MKKQIGDFSGEVWKGGWPVHCSIVDDHGGELRFDHRQIADLEFLVSRMKQEAKAQLPSELRHEV